jgi:hypothetical protein
VKLIINVDPEGDMSPEDITFAANWIDAVQAGMVTNLLGEQAAVRVLIKLAAMLQQAQDAPEVDKDPPAATIPIRHRTTAGSFDFSGVMQATRDQASNIFMERVRIPSGNDQLDWVNLHFAMGLRHAPPNATIYIDFGELTQRHILTMIRDFIPHVLQDQDSALADLFDRIIEGLHRVTTRTEQGNE